MAQTGEKDQLNQRLKEQPENKKLVEAIKKMETDYLPRQKRYEEQERKLGGQSSYSKTDEAATFIGMKEDRGAKEPLPKPAYNIQTGTEDEFVVGFSLHQRSGDTTCLIPRLEGVEANLAGLPGESRDCCPGEKMPEHAFYPCLPMPDMAVKRTMCILRKTDWRFEIQHLPQ